jgi:SSS family solute:Na+ symporter
MTGLEWGLILGYFALTLGVGWYSGRGNKAGEDLHLGGRSTPWVAALISLVATEVSAATLLGSPQAAFEGALFYVQLMLGSLVARYIVAFYFLPSYYDTQVVTVYEFLERRLGAISRQLTSALFLIGRLVADGARLYLAALTLDALFGVGIPLATGILVITTAIYTMHGGIKAVIWTDVLQGVVFLGGGMIILGTLGGGLLEAGQSVGQLLSQLREAGKLDVFKPGDLHQALTDPYSFPAAFLGGIFLTMATHGTDHDMAQRVLTCRNRQDSMRSLLWSGWASLAVGLLFLSVGLTLWLAAQHGAFQAVTGVSPILTYLKDYSHPVLRAIFTAAILAAAMSTLSSAFAASTATLSNDLLPLSWRDTLAKNRLIMLLLSLLVWALALGTHAFKLAHPHWDLLRLALSSLTLVYGALLAFFVTALFTRSRPSPARCVTAAVAGVLLGFTLFFKTSLAFEWLVPAGLLLSGAILNLGVPREGPGSGQEERAPHSVTSLEETP